MRFILIVFLLFGMANCEIEKTELQETIEELVEEEEELPE